MRKLSTQARDPAPHSQHSEIGYNYRMRNVLAAIGRGQLRVLDELQHKVKESAPTGALHLERVGILGETGSAAQAAARWTMGRRAFLFSAPGPGRGGGRRPDDSSRAAIACVWRGVGV